MGTTKSIYMSLVAAERLLGVLDQMSASLSEEDRRAAVSILHTIVSHGIIPQSCKTTTKEGTPHMHGYGPNNWECEKCGKMKCDKCPLELACQCPPPTAVPLKE